MSESLFKVELDRLTKELKKCAEQRQKFRLERDAARKVAIDLVETLSIIAAQDPKDPIDRPTKLGCVCLLAKATIKELGTNNENLTWL